MKSGDIDTPDFFWAPFRRKRVSALTSRVPDNFTNFTEINLELFAAN